MMFSLANYFNRRRLPGFIGKRYAELLHRGTQFVESAELNESQGIAHERLSEVGDGAFGAISLREGGAIVIDQGAGTVLIGASTVWAGGYMHRVPEVTLTNVPMNGTVSIGVAVTEEVITDIEDVELKGMVPGTASQGAPLAARLRYDAVWATDGDPFYPVFTLIDGQLPNEVLPPQDSAAELAVERHVKEDHGSHIVDGFQVSPAGYSTQTGAQTFVISAGTLRAEGRRVHRSTDQRYSRIEDPTLVQVNGETQLYPAGGVVTLNNGPIAEVQTVTVIKEVTRTVTHQLAGGSDALPDTPVYEIVSVVQGATTYAPGTDYIKTGDTVSWAPNGAEPSPSSSYDVTYRYVATVVPDAIDRFTISLGAAVVDEPVTIQYSYKLRRIDVLAIDLDGSVVYLKGLSNKYNPVPPSVPTPLAPLARIDNQWGIDPIITDIDQRRLTEAEVRALLRTVLDMGDLLSQVSLEKDIQERDPASRRGSFVEPFQNELQRDLGIAQDAAIVSGILTLPIETTVQTVDIGSVPILLPFVTEPVLSQPYRTAARKINRYLAFDPLPSPLSLNPAVDRWNENQSSSSSSSTASLVEVASYRPDLLGTPLYGTTSFSRQRTSVTTSSSNTSDLPFLRSIAVDFECSRMGPGEQLDSLTFDGIDVTGSVTGTQTADASGVMTGAFTIPANIKAGTKEVVVTGQGGSRGVTSFTGQGTLTVTHYHTATHTLTTATTIDPVAQSFVLPEPRQVTGARVEFTEQGDVANPVVLELRAMDEGSLPGRDTLAEGSITGNFTVSDPSVDQPENWTEIDFRFPSFVAANEYRWIALLTSDADHSVAVAQLGDQSDAQATRGFDARRQEWIRQNPMQGDFADGSNGVSWLLHPDTDLTCEIMAARYTSTTRTVDIGTFDLSAIDPDGISDILVLLVIEQPSQACQVRLEMVRAGGEVISFEPGVALHLDEYLTEEVSIRMVLTGTDTLSPVVMPECQIVWGRLKETADYVSEAVTLDQSAGNLKVRSVVEVRTPGTSSITLSLGDDGNWTAQGSPLTMALGDDWVEREYLASPVTDTETRQLITLTGTPKHRPAARQLRIRATEV
jgi:hypothetical protein